MDHGIEHEQTNEGSMGEDAPLEKATRKATVRLKSEATITKKVMLELLDWDERPTFILDVGYASREAGFGNKVYTNITLRNEPGLVEDLLGKRYDGEYSEEQVQFWEWVKNQDATDDGDEQPFKRSYGEWDWAKFLFRDRWYIVRGTRISSSHFMTSPFLPVHLAKPLSRPQYSRGGPSLTESTTRNRWRLLKKESTLKVGHYHMPQHSSKRRFLDDTTILRSDKPHKTKLPSSKRAHLRRAGTVPLRLSPHSLHESLVTCPPSDSSSSDEGISSALTSEHSDTTPEPRTPTSIGSAPSPPSSMSIVSPKTKSSRGYYSDDTFEQFGHFRSERGMSEQTQIPEQREAQTVSTPDVVSSHTNGTVPNETDQSREQSFKTAGKSTSIPRHIDWTRYPNESPSAFIDFFRKFDWASTLPGPMECWSDQLKSLVFMMNSDPDPSLILWGHSRERCMIYNEACVHIFGSKHPAALGARPEDIFAELWEYILPGVEQVELGKATQLLDFSVPMIRHGYLEETFWCITDLPILCPLGIPLGCYCRFTESTGKAIAERKMKMLLRLGEASASAADLRDLWPKVLQTFEETDDTMPFAAVYSVVNGQSTQSSEYATPLDMPSKSSKLCVLESTMGILRECLPEELDLSNYGEYLSLYLTQAWKSNEPVFLKHEDGTLPDQMRHPIPGRGSGDPCQAAVIFPIRFVQEHHLLAFIILGLNPRRPFIEQVDYMKLLNKRLVDGAAAVFLPEEERRNAEALHAADMRQAAIASQLLSLTKEVASRENRQDRFIRLSRDAPVGMYLFNPDGSIIFINDAYFEMLGLKRDDFEGAYGWSKEIKDEDLPAVDAAWRRVAEERLPVIVDFRVKKPFKFINEDGIATVGETWLQSSAFPQTTEEGETDSVIGWQTDISHRKYAESLQKQRLQDALDSKRQSENFIDMTSHEMRNPLSAILQSSDGIMTALPMLPMLMSKLPNPNPEIQEAMSTIADNAQTIILCAQHQKRIVDDILALSKLDSNLLIITPDRADPIAIAEHVLKMYEGELQRHHIETELSIKDQFKEHQIDYVYLDPTRLIQVLINLLSNAIKFTQSRDHRRISISICSFVEKPTKTTFGASFFTKKIRTNPPCTDAIDTSHPSFGEPVFLEFSVSDSGRGISEAQIDSLFQRFTQATPRTHIKYGGSGLGLFISRELTEMQGGQIGVSSKLGIGSTFSFYVKAWRFVPHHGRVKSVGEATALPFTTTALDPSRPPSPKKPKLPDKLHVLVVEDNLINQKLMATQLRRLGCVVCVANHGQEALETLEKSTFWVSPGSGITTSESVATDTQDNAKPTPVELHIILMDIEMPIMDGLTCVREIRRLQKEHRFVGHVPVIAVTANARDAQKAKAVDMGMDMVVTKPFRIPDLVPQMEKLILETQAM